MKKTITTIKAFAAFLVIAGAITFTSCSTNQNAASKSEIDSLRNQITQLVLGNTEVADHLVRFDTLDFTVFTVRNGLV